MSATVAPALNAKLLAEAETLGIDVPKEIEIHLRVRIEKRKREFAWREQNRAAIEQWNEWIEKNGIPFEELRPW